MLYCSQNLKRTVLLSYNYLFYSVLSFCKKASHAFLQNEFFIVTQTFIEAHKHPSYLPAPRRVSRSRGQPWPGSAHGQSSGGEASLHGRAQSRSPRHLCARKEHLTTVQRLSFPQQTTPTVLVTAEIPTPGTRKNNRFLY